MSSDAFEQFAEEFGCWITDHGVTGVRGGLSPGGVWTAEIHLATLEAAIRDLIVEARAQVAADTATQLDAVLKTLNQGRDPVVMTREHLSQLRSELTETANPDGECASCGHISQPEYRHGTADHVGQPGGLVTLYAVRDLLRRVRSLETTLGLRP